MVRAGAGCADHLRRSHRDRTHGTHRTTRHSTDTERTPRGSPSGSAPRAFRQRHWNVARDATPCGGQGQHDGQSRGALVEEVLRSTRTGRRPACSCPRRRVEVGEPDLAASGRAAPTLAWPLSTRSARRRSRCAPRQPGRRESVTSRSAARLNRSPCARIGAQRRVGGVPAPGTSGGGAPPRLRRGAPAWACPRPWTTREACRAPSR